MSHKCCKHQKRGCRGPEGPMGPPGNTGSTGPTGTFEGVVSSGSFNPTIIPESGVDSIETEIGHYIRINNIVFVTIKGLEMTTNGAPIVLILDGLPFPKSTSVDSGEGTATGSNPLNPSTGSLSGVCLANTDFLVDCNMRDSDPTPDKIWTNVGFSFSYVIPS